MLYRCVRWVIRLAVTLFYRVEVHRAADEESGAVLFVGNHPNSLIDPALVLVSTRRQVTFLAKEPLFRIPVIKSLLRALGALPVFRRQDDPAQMGRNTETLDAAAGALVKGGAITLFPEGRSHSEPRLSELKTGCARIAFAAAAQGAQVRIIPVGLTYAEKHRFRSQVRVELGAPIVLSGNEAGEVEAVRALTARIAAGLNTVTLNLASWEELGLVETAEALYALRVGEVEHDAERLRRFARGLALLRDEQPQRWERIRAQLSAFRRRLGLVRAEPGDLSLQYRRVEVYPFIARNLVALLFGFPLFALGTLLFAPPFLLIRFGVAALHPEEDMVATLKVLASLILAPLWWLLLSSAAFRLWGTGAGVASLMLSPALAAFTRYFLERRAAAAGDVITFLRLGNRSRLKASLLAEGEVLATEIEALATELGPRVETVGAESDRGNNR